MEQVVEIKKHCIYCFNEKLFNDFVNGRKVCKICYKDYMKAYYRERTESIIEKQKNYYSENKEKLKSYSKTYYQNNKEKIKKNSLQKYYKNKNKDNSLNSN